MVEQATPERLEALYTRDNRATLASGLLRLFERWQLTTAQQLTLLGYSRGSRATLKRLREGGPLPASRDVLDRAGHLLGIHKSLRLIYPRNPRARYGWITSRNRDFDERSPLEVIETYGLPGLLMVRTYLDHARGD